MIMFIHKRYILIVMLLAALLVLFAGGIQAGGPCECFTGGYAYTVAGDEAVTPGQQAFHRLGETGFAMRLAPGAVFPTGLEDDGVATVEQGFWIAETEVTYRLWYEVYTWATHPDRGSDRYSFVKPGREGGKDGEVDPNRGGPPTGRGQEPVTSFSWGNTIAWLNALTGYHNEIHGTSYLPVYTIQGETLRHGLLAEVYPDLVVEEPGRSGFRLPSSREWELAARYQGTHSSHGAIEYPPGSGIYWTPGSYASGAKADYEDETANRAAAWYGSGHDDIGNTTQTRAVGQKPASGSYLGLYDMAGNVWEWCFDQVGANRVVKGGGWGSPPGGLRLAYIGSGVYPSFTFNDVGIRLVRSFVPGEEVPWVEGEPEGEGAAWYRYLILRRPRQ